jgi:cytoskeletal protein CcmA (bactofilin family)
MAALQPGAQKHSPLGGAQSGPPSRLSRKLNVTGDIVASGELTVDGSVTGSVRAQRFVLGPDGLLEGDVLALEAEIYGRLNGRVFASKVSLAATCHVKGRVFHHTIEVARGAFIDGRMPWRPPAYFETLDEIPETNA